MAVKGRGASSNRSGRFEKLSYVADPTASAEEQRPATEFFRDSGRSFLSYNRSPDVGFDVSANPYRGCEHGCAYCYARPTHEYLGWSAGLDFETRIMVKEKAPEILRRELSSPRWKPQLVAFSGVTDPYQPAERRLRLTRRCLEVMLDFRNPVAIVTKNHLVTRDADLFQEMRRWNTVAVNLSITTLDRHLQRRLEPRTSSPQARLQAIRHLSDLGIPVRVMIAPVIPALNDHEIPSLLEAAAEAGAGHAGYIVLRLPHGVKELFGEWLDESYPERRAKVLARLMEIRGGRLNDPSFFSRMKGSGTYSDQIGRLFEVARRKVGLDKALPDLSIAHFRRPGQALQPSLWRL